jgi:RimJ/RimL family protein N-acetyltransferase
MTEYYYQCLPKRLYQQGNYTLEAVQSEHIEKLRQWRNEQMDVLRQSKTISKEQQIIYYEKHIWPELKNDEPRQILLSFLSNNELIGYGGLVHISWEHLRAEISFICNPRIFGQDQLYRICFIKFLEMIKDVSFNSLGLKRLFTETFSFRKEQISVLIDFGMEIEGVLKSSYKINGKYCDSVIQSVINKC